MGKCKDILAPKAIPVLAIPKQICRSLVMPAQQVADGGGTSIQATLRLVPRDSVHSFSSPVASTGEHVLAVESVELPDQAVSSPASSRAGDILRDCVHVPVRYYSSESHSLTTPFDVDSTRYHMPVQLSLYFFCDVYFRLRHLAPSLMAWENQCRPAAD